MNTAPHSSTCSKDAPHPTIRFQHTVASLLLLAVGLPQVAAAADLVWDNPETGSWDLAENWSPATVPTGADDITIDNSGTVRLATGVNGTVDDIIIGKYNMGTLAVSGGTLTNGRGYIGQSSGSDGTATVSGGAWNNSRDLHIGVYSGSNGTLEVSGGTVSNNYGYIGFNVDSSGTAIVSGGIWNSNELDVGYVGAGTLEVSGGTVTSTYGVIAKHAKSNGMATVSGGEWNNSRNFYVGYQSQNTAILNVTGGRLTNDNGFIGYDNFARLASGIATVSGGEWYNSGDLHVGYKGIGTLNITGGTVTNDIGYLGNKAGSSGAATVSNGMWNSASNLFVGYSGTGMLNVSGGTVTNTISVIGSETGSSGTATVSSGTWNNSGSATVGNLGNGTLNITDTGNMIVSNGNGTVTLARLGGTGTLNLGTGGMAGTLDLAEVTGGGGTAIFNFNHTGSVNFDPRLTGSLSVNKLGAGTTILTGENSYTGATQIDAGTLLVNGSLGSTTVNVANGATLGGSGSIGGNVNVLSGGFLAPGNSPGILSMHTLTLASGSTTLMELNGLTPGAEHDQIVVTNNAALDGTLQLSYDNSPMNGDTFTLIDADSISGDFTSVINSLGNALTFTSQVREGSAFEVTAVQSSFTNFVGTDPDLIKIAQLFDNNSSDPGLLPIINSLNLLPGEELDVAFEQINPQELTALSGMTFANARNASYNLGNRLSEVRSGSAKLSTAGFNLYDETGQHLRQSLVAATEIPAGTQPQPLDAPSSDALSYFISGNATVGDVDGDSKGPGYEEDSFSVLLGANYQFASNLSLGLYGGYDNSNADFGGDGGHSDLDSYRFGLLGTWWTPLPEGNSNTTHFVFTEAYFGGAYHEFDTVRHSYGGAATGDTDGHELDTGVAVGYTVEHARWIFTTKLNLDYAKLWIDAYNESGGLAPLDIDDMDSDSLYSTLSFRVDYRCRLGNFDLQPYAQIGARHQYLDQSESVTARFPDSAAGPFTVHGTETSRDSLIGALGVNAQLREGLSAQLGYYGEHNNDIDFNSINASFSLTF